MSAITATRNQVRTPPPSNTKNVVNSVLVAGTTVALTAVVLAGFDAVLREKGIDIFPFYVTEDIHRMLLHVGEYGSPIVGAVAGIYNYLNNS